MNLTENTSSTDKPIQWRSGLQPLMPAKAGNKPDGYDIYPFHNVGEGKILSGYNSLVRWMTGHKFVALDGYAGVFWDDVQGYLQHEFDLLGVTVTWIKMSDYLKPVEQVQQMVAPYLSSPGSVWGTKASLILSDFYDLPGAFNKSKDTDITVIIGTMAAQAAYGAGIVYFDLPKNELQLRMRTGAVNNLGANAATSPAEMYKRFYFVDWVVFNQYKKQLLNDIDIVADAQWNDTVNWMYGNDLKTALHHLSNNVFRVRPWFEPGAWGGHWMKERIAGLNQDEVNYAWSFELIVPENGLVFESDGNLLEVSFDLLMFAERYAVLGDFAEKFGDEFPIRFDFLDTWRGGNLSIQCHPSVPYIQQNFGEHITQDETYYILDCEADAGVYLGFQDDIDPATFRKELEDSQQYNREVNITNYVQLHKANKHDLFLIPNGTVHSAGAGNLVLEISATPYIFTFKMYDWLRLDLNGQPRAINIEHAFNNLNFERKGDRVQAELLSKPSVTEQGNNWQLVHLPTHADHFYDVHRLEFDTSIDVETNGSCHVLMLVEGTSVIVKTKGNEAITFQYAETFVIPAAAKTYTLTNAGLGRAKVIKAFLKPINN
ncbi:class I mannose-6-phosphate isomerase [Mucilaginibacter sp. UR6-1]|uniref:class I mannose-6-phosphate isomerase n=1 Tax=Mucilaginibacter sp. UR6-1 TaxID=1435643 RepID=UPI001E4EAAB8|nr:class I mannose-6-phosphate isomerase [Mucilaginibacter sp. UR6-1]MCC8407917.1 class I mannose-6-phosphate isomerase [Mucilaginibacter sp. UR6-1]